MTLFALIFWLIVLGAVAFLAQRAPFISPEFKSFITYALIVIGVLILLVFVAGLLGQSIGDLRLR